MLPSTLICPSEKAMCGESIAFSLQVSLLQASAVPPLATLKTPVSLFWSSGSWLSWPGSCGRATPSLQVFTEHHMLFPGSWQIFCSDVAHFHVFQMVKCLRAEQQLQNDPQNFVSVFLSKSGIGI